MPEGDTVFRTARALHRALAGRRLTAAELRIPQLAATDLAGWTVLESLSRGKHLLLRMREPVAGATRTLHSHLGLDGSWRVYAVGERWRARRRDPGAPCRRCGSLIEVADQAGRAMYWCPSCQPGVPGAAGAAGQPGRPP